MTSKSKRPQRGRKFIGGVAHLRHSPLHPGSVFKEIREGQEDPVSQRQAAIRLGLSNNYLNMIELGQRPVSPETAIKFEALTGASAEFWMNLQVRYDLWHALKTLKKGGRVIPGEAFGTRAKALELTASFEKG